MGEPAPIARPPTTQQVVLAELRRRILSRQLRPGDPIRSDNVAAELHVSRVPVREALKILEGEGQIVYRPHHGYFVTDLRRNDLVEIYRIRQILESEAVRIAVPQLDGSTLEVMREAMHDMEALDADEIMPMTAANRRFHFALLEAAEMPHLLHHIHLLWNATDPFRSLYYMDAEHLALVLREHREIFDAVTRDDAEAAVELLNEHRENAIDALAQVLTEEDERAEAERRREEAAGT